MNNKLDALLIVDDELMRLGYKEVLEHYNLTTFVYTHEELQNKNLEFKYIIINSDIMELPEYVVGDRVILITESMSRPIHMFPHGTVVLKHPVTAEQLRNAIEL